MNDPILTDQVVAFYRSLDESDARAFAVAVDALAEHGIALKRPIVGEVVMDRREVRGKAYSREVLDAFGKRLKELRPTRHVRVLFLFAPNRVPVLLYAFDKSRAFADSYYHAVPTALDIWTSIEADFR